MKKKVVALSIAAALMATFILSPLGAYGVSLAAMSVYSHMESEDSYMAQKGIEIEMPSGEGWYPFVMTFNADEGFASFSGGEARKLTIMYNFPEFDLKKGCSRLYDDSSPYYSSFYGAYCVEGDYGFDEDGNLKVEEAGRVPQYDYTKLVLRDLGLPVENQVFRWQTTGVSEGVELAGYEEWTRVDASLTVNGVLHEKEEFLRNYIQYGSPGYDTEENFAPVNMVGRVYGRYFEEEEAGIYFYIITADPGVLDRWDKEILRESKIAK